MRGKTLLLIPLDMNVGKRPKNLKHGEVRFLLEHERIGNIVIVCSSGKSVMKVDNSGNSLGPEGGRKVRLIEESCCRICYRMHGTLCNTI